MNFKAFFLSFILLLCLGITFAQKKYQRSTKTYPFVKVTNWSKKAMVIPEETWTQYKDQIISLVGEQEYLAIRKNYDYRSIPAQMTLWNGREKKNLKELHKKLDSLSVIFKIATFNLIDNSGEQRAILKIPYKGNENWDKNAKWDSVYIIINAKYVVELNAKNSSTVQVKEKSKKQVTITKESWYNAKEQTTVTLIEEGTKDNIPNCD